MCVNVCVNYGRIYVVSGFVLTCLQNPVIVISDTNDLKRDQHCRTAGGAAWVCVCVCMHIIVGYFYEQMYAGKQNGVYFDSKLV